MPNHSCNAACRRQNDFFVFRLLEARASNFDSNTFLTIHLTMSEAGNKRKAKDKAFYIKSAKQARISAGELGPGMKGFLCTSNREKDSVREAYNVI